MRLLAGWVVMSVKNIMKNAWPTGQQLTSGNGTAKWAAMARQNERQWHGEFVLPMQLLAKLSVKTIMKDAWHCPITKGAAIKQPQRHGKMSGNGMANLYCQCNYLQNWVKRVQKGAKIIWIGNATVANGVAVNQQQLVLQGPVIWTGKKSKLNRTVTDCNRTAGYGLQ